MTLAPKGHALLEGVVSPGALPVSKIKIADPFQLNIGQDIASQSLLGKK